MGRLKNILRNINYLSKHSLWDQREEDIVYLTNKILDDGIYEYSLDLKEYKKYIILDKWESIDYISKTGLSFVRFNDGEINLMKGIDQPFQKYDRTLVNIMFKMLEESNEKIIVGINRDDFSSLYSLEHNGYIRRHAYDFRQFLREYCDFDRTYIDASCTFWIFGEHSKESEKFWYTWKEMFRDKTITIVCGEGILDKLEYDVFELCKEKKFIYGPKKNAWSEHNRIISDITSKVDKDTLIVFILGMAGKAMIYEVAELGYTAWDIGHLAKSYDAYMKNIEYSSENISKFYAPD